MIKILAIPPDIYAVGKFRIADPYKYIGENYSQYFRVDIVYNVPFDDSYFNDYDVIVIHSFVTKNASHEMNIQLINRLKNRGKIVIVDTDDYWSVDQRHPLYSQIKAQGIAKKRAELLSVASYVTTTTTLFKKEIQSSLNLKNNVFVFPNAINDEEEQFNSKKSKSELIRFGFLGGSSHLHDIQLLKDGIDIIHDNYKDKVQFVLSGFDTRGTVNVIDKQTGEMKQRDILPQETTWFEYEKIFTKNYSVLDENYRNFLFTFKKGTYDDLNKPYRRIWTEEVSRYAHNYNNFDVSLVPLYESKFNEMKSQLKILEAGFHKKAVIAQDFGPYTIDLINAVDNGNFNSNGNALLVNTKRNHKQWGQHMKKLIDNPNMIEDLGERLYETVKDKYSLKNVCKNRVDFLKSFVK